ncbi:hypothetical protein ACHAXR_003772 [Thalassiosira sp. AJA248-18]
MGGIFQPYDKCSKTGLPVIDVLRSKHPEAVIPPAEDFDAYPDYPDSMEFMPMYFWEEHVAKAATRLSGGAGPCGLDGIQLKNWLLRHEVHSERLRSEMAQWVSWLANEYPPYAAYRALNSLRELPADKRPGSKSGATIACGNTQLCAGLKSGIEANLHAVWAIWPQSAGWTHGSEEVEVSDAEAEPLPATQEINPSAMAMANNPHVDPGAAKDDRRSGYEAGTGYGATLFDAKNGFNELNRYLILWNVAHLWRRGSRFTFNRYCHWGICIVHDHPGLPTIVIHSKRGMTQRATAGP